MFTERKIFEPISFGGVYQLSASVSSTTLKGNRFGKFKLFLWRKGAEVGRKVNEAGSKLLRGREEGKDYLTPQALPGAAAKGKGSCTGDRRLPPRPRPPPAGETAEGVVNMNGHPGRVMIRDTNQTGAPWGSPAVDRQGKRLFPGGRRRRAAQPVHYTPEETRFQTGAQADSVSFPQAG